MFLAFLSTAILIKTTAFCVLIFLVDLNKIRRDSSVSFAINRTV